ncbi:MAG: PEP/pyruvate-binding domain-containing protein, partial [Candidatus Promineifilaceae bacterium]|nr:PEP/pyruvate-binding domain-containing protein [Candidatus Promineifilaceae bacterium]
MSDFVIPLGTADAVPTALGGRGDRLNRLALDRLPVEPGLVLTSAAYSAFVRFNNLESELAAMEELDPADPAALVSAAVRIRRRFLEATLPPTLAERLDVLWANLAGRTLQVQASWHPETPTPSASAGTRLRYAPVDNRAALLSAVRACWASVWTAPLLNRQAAEPVAVAVIVQETMQPSASGTLSTGVREAGRTEELIITASAGDASLRGRMAAQERYVIDKGRGDVKHVQLGAEPLLNPDLLTELALAGLAAEQTMAQPLTITWALVRGRFIIVQADPLLAHEDAATSADWSRAVVGAHWPEPLTPLTWSLWAPLLTRAGRDVAARWRLFPRGEAPDPWLSRINGHLVWQQKRLVEAFSAAYGLPAGLTTSTDGPEKGSRWRYRSLLRRLPRLVRLWRRPAASAAGAGSDGRESAATEQQAGDALW